MTSKSRAITAAVLAALGAVVTAVVLAEGTPALDEDRLSRWVQGVEWFRPIAGSTRALTGTEIVLLLGAAGVAWLTSARAHRRAVVLGAALVVLLVVQVGMKEAIDRERPTVRDVEVHASGISPSFPSGHALGGTLLWGYVLLSATPPGASRYLWPVVRAGALVLLVTGPVASVYLGAHWPTDVIGGVFIGGALLLGALAVEGWWLREGEGEDEVEAGT